MEFKLPELPFERNALEPHISSSTVHFHYDKHHAGYLDKLDEALSDGSKRDASLEDIIRDAYRNEDASVFNPAAQVYNHNMYWASLNPHGADGPTDQAKEAIDSQFGSVESFREEFREKALGQFGSGWTWLVYDPACEGMRVLSTSDAMTPLVAGMQPIVTLDVWEHAYYLDFQNERGKYVDAFLGKLISWERIERKIDDVPIAAWRPGVTV